MAQAAVLGLFSIFSECITYFTTFFDFVDYLGLIYGFILRKLIIPVGGQFQKFLESKTYGDFSVF